ILEIAGHSREHIIVRRVQIVKNRFGQSVFFAQAAKESRQSLRLRPVTGGIETLIATQSSHRVGVGVPQSSEVELLDPAFLGVQMGRVQQNETGESKRRVGRHGMSSPDLLKDRGGFRFAAEVRWTYRQTVIRSSATVLVKEIVALAQGVQQICKPG